MSFCDHVYDHSSIYCKERRSPSLLMAQRDNVLVPLTKGGKSNKRERIWKCYIVVNK